MRKIVGVLLGALLTSGTAFAAGTVQLNAAPRVGGSAIVYGNCGSAGAGGTIIFSLDQNGTSTIIPSVGNKVASDGSFAAGVGIADSVHAGLATLSAACPNGAIVSSLIAIEPPFADGSVVKGYAPTVYIIRGGVKYGIPSLTVFYRLGLSFNNLINLSDQELQNYPDGGVQN